MHQLRTGGPYHIATAESWRAWKDSRGKPIRRRLYWKVAWGNSVGTDKNSTNSGPVAMRSEQEAENIDGSNRLISQHEMNGSDSNETEAYRSSASNLADCITMSEPHHTGSTSLIGNNATQSDATPSTRSEGKCAKVGNVNFSIVCTPNKDEASNFYLKPIIQSSSKEDKYFFIVTDPEDCQRSMHRDTNKQVAANQNGSLEESTTIEPGIQVSQEGNEAQQPLSLDTSQLSKEHETLQLDADLDQLDEPQRYVMVINNNLKVGLNLKRHMRYANFKLKNLQEQTRPLTKSHWLPDALRGSQPHIICGRKGALKKLHRVYIKYSDTQDNQDMEIRYGQTKPTSECERYSYFILEAGHYT